MSRKGRGKTRREPPLRTRKAKPGEIFAPPQGRRARMNAKPAKASKPLAPPKPPTITQLNQIQRLRDVARVTTRQPSDYFMAERQIGALEAYLADGEGERD